MSWHDDHSSGSPAEGQQGYRPRSTGSPARRARRNDGYFYENDEDYRDDKSCSTDYVRSDDSNNSRIGGGSSARSDKIIDDGAYSASGDGSSCDWGSEETGGVGREDHGDAVVLRSLEEAISKSSATRRRPSTASSATRKAFRDTIVACNSLAMLSLGRGDPARCRDLLARALDLASDANITAGEDRRGGGALGRDPADVDPALQVLTLNNTACLHRRYNEAVKLARDPDVQNEALIQTFQRSYAGARKVSRPSYCPNREIC
eukprot:jgi/Undpi1/695/HiC_scaffold_10.g04159.m1